MSRIVDARGLSCPQPVLMTLEEIKKTVKGEIETAHHVEYIFGGQISRYHLDFSAPVTRFEISRGLFEEMAELFTYLRSSP